VPDRLICRFVLQAAGPVLSTTCKSWEGRTWNSSDHIAVTTAYSPRHPCQELREIPPSDQYQWAAVAAELCRTGTIIKMRIPLPCHCTTPLSSHRYCSSTPGVSGWGTPRISPGPSQSETVESTRTRLGRYTSWSFGCRRYVRLPRRNHQLTRSGN
jgi:hypothetical protein